MYMYPHIFIILPVIILYLIQYLTILVTYAMQHPKSGAADAVSVVVEGHG